MTFLNPFKNRDLSVSLALAFFISSAWWFLAGRQYLYNYYFLTINGFGWFTWLFWGLGLFFSYLVYSIIVHSFKIRFLILRFLLYIFIYWLLLLSAETFGYFVLNVHNMATSQYPGLPICHCLHAPLWMQISYFILGPAYFCLINFWFNFKVRLISRS